MVVVVDVAVAVVGRRVAVVVGDAGEEVADVTAAAVVGLDGTGGSDVEAASPEHATRTRGRATRSGRTPARFPPLRCLGPVGANPGAFTRRI
jgi:hypothetical protein